MARSDKKRKRSGLVSLVAPFASLVTSKLLPFFQCNWDAVHAEGTSARESKIVLALGGDVFAQMIVDQKTGWQQQPRAECPDKVLPFAVCLRKIFVY